MQAVGSSQAAAANPDATLCPVGMRDLTVTVKNNSGSALVEPLMVVHRFTKNLAYDAEGGPQGVGARILLQGFTGNDVWEDQETIVIVTRVCLREADAYQFFVDFLAKYQ